MDEEVDEVECPRIVDGNKCGAKVKKKQNFCFECGSKVDAAWFIKSLNSDPNLCDGVDEDGYVCGQVIPSTFKFCPNCGKRRKLLKVQIVFLNCERFNQGTIKSTMLKR